MQIYLDYSATTPTHPQVIERVATILQHDWGNPSSLHTWGQDTATVIEMAREQVAGLINANSDQIIFTSGGTAIKLKLISPPGKPPKAGSNVKPKAKSGQGEKIKILGWEMWPHLIIH